MDWFYINVLLLLVLSALFSGSETGIYSINRVKLRYRLEQGNDLRARILHRLITPIGPTIICILLGNNIAAQLLATVTEQQFHELGFWSVIITTFALTPIVLIFAEFLPKYIFRTKANDITYKVVFALAFFRYLLIIPIIMANMITKMLQVVLRTGREAVWEPHTSEGNLRSFLKAESSGHDLTPVQQNLVNRIMALDRTLVTYEGVSKPLSVIATLDSEATASATRNSLGPTYYTRYLVTDHNNGKPIGYVSAATLVCAEDHEKLGDILQPMPQINANTTVQIALQQLHANGADMALIPESDGKNYRVLFRSDCVRVLANMK